MQQHSTIVRLPNPADYEYDSMDEYARYFKSTMDTLTNLLGKPNQGEFGWTISNTGVILNQMGVLIKVKWGESIRILEDGSCHSLGKAEFEVTPPFESNDGFIINFLDKVLETQEHLDSSWGRFPELDDDLATTAYIRDQILCATDELHEVLECVDWKPWKAEKGIKDRDAFLEEVTDVVHFILGLYLAAGADGEEILHHFRKKSSENFSRLTNEDYLHG